MERKKQSGRFRKLAALLAVVMCMGMVTVPSLADTSPDAGEGSGSGAAQEQAVPEQVSESDVFDKIQEYREGQFVDVKADDWFAEDVKEAYETGLMIGDSGNTFNPKGYVTIAETVTIAARMHKKYTDGSLEFEEASPWYSPYMQYALDNGIVSERLAGNPNAAATRAQFAAILSRALPLEAMTVINKVTLDNIPDVSAATTYSLEILKMYQAGILNGNDGFGTFLPGRKIQRSEVAAIVNRLAHPSHRVIFDPLPIQREISLKGIPGIEGSITIDVNRSTPAE